MGRVSDYGRKENRREVREGEGLDRSGRAEREKENSAGEYRIGFCVESIQSRGESLNCLCLFRKQRSAAVHQNGRSRQPVADV